VIVFQAGTASKNGKLYTSGGRVLTVTALGNTLREAKDRVYRAVGSISFEGAYYRKDIGHRALQ
jgi:phosphoribosylamine---glycine ligase